MDKIKELKEGLKALITDKTSAEDAEKIGKLSAHIDGIEQEQNALLASKEELRQKYVAIVTTASFGGKPSPDIPDTPKAKTFEECLADAQKK